MAGGRFTFHRGGRLGLALVACTVVVLVISAGTAHAAGGPVILGGDDLTEHGSRDTTANVNVGGWLYLERALEGMEAAVARPGALVSIAALGATDSTATSANAGAAIHYAAQEVADGIPVTYYNGGPAIDAFFADLRAGAVQPAIIWIAGNGSTNDLSDDPTEPAALANNVTTIGDFVNGGGGLISHGSEYGWLTSFSPGATFVPSGGSGDLEVTSQGQNMIPGLTDADVNAGHWHGHFERALQYLSPLVVSGTVDDEMGRDARVIVGDRSVILPGSVTLSPSGGVRMLDTPTAVTATVRNDQGQLQQGTTVTFTIVSGPNFGETGTAVTDVNGNAQFTWVGDGGEGVDTLQASFVAPAGDTRSATAWTEWTSLPVISMLSPEGLPLVLAATAGVLVLWLRRRRLT